MSHSAPLKASQKSVSAIVRDLERQERMLAPALAPEPDPWRPLEPIKVEALPLSFPASAPFDDNAPSLARRIVRSNTSLAFICGLVAPGTVCLLAGAFSMPPAPTAHWTQARLGEFKVAEADVPKTGQPNADDASSPPDKFARVLAYLREEARNAVPPAAAAEAPRVLVKRVVDLRADGNAAAPVITASEHPLTIASISPMELRPEGSASAVKAVPPIAEFTRPASPRVQSHAPTAREAARDNPSPSKRGASKSAKADAAVLSASPVYSSSSGSKAGAKPLVRVASREPLDGETRLGAGDVRTSKRASGAPSAPVQRAAPNARSTPAEQPTSPSLVSGFLGFLGF
jgi:hypothetical protein